MPWVSMQMIRDFAQARYTSALLGLPQAAVSNSLPAFWEKQDLLFGIASPFLRRGGGSERQDDEGAPLAALERRWDAAFAGLGNAELEHAGGSLADEDYRWLRRRCLREVATMRAMQIEIEQEEAMLARLEAEGRWGREGGRQGAVTARCRVPPCAGGGLDKARRFAPPFNQALRPKRRRRYACYRGSRHADGFPSSAKGRLGKWLTPATTTQFCRFIQAQAGAPLRRLTGV